MRRWTISLAIVLALALVIGGVTRRAARATKLTSGLPVASSLPSFHPCHATGADKGTMECPVCKYTANPAVQVWVSSDDDKNIAAIAAALEKAAVVRGNMKFKAFVIYTNTAHQPEAPLRKKLVDMASACRLQNVALTFLGSSGGQDMINYEINLDPRVRNTIFVYKALKVHTKFVNLTADRKGLAALNQAINQVVL